MESSDGISIENKVWINIGFDNSVTFQTAFDRMYSIKAFFELIAGRPQNLMGVNICIKDPQDQEKILYLDVYDCGSPRYGKNDNDRAENVISLIDIANNPDEFSEILINWVGKNDEWKSARGQFYSNFRKENLYDIDRLIGAANMFDILPDSAFPSKISLTREVKGIKNRCKCLLQRLPEDIDTSTVLSDLSRLGTQTLKQKIRYRAKKTIEHGKWELPQLYTAIDEAVKCRNHYVHGRKARIDYFESGIIPFLTATLEFLFVASDLLESGWKTKDTLRDPHPIGLYLSSYRFNLSKLQSALRTDEK